MSMLLGIRHSQDAVHAGSWILFPCEFSANSDGSRSRVFCPSRASDLGVSVSRPTFKVHTGIPERDASQKLLVLEYFISKPTLFCLGFSKPYR